MSKKDYYEILSVSRTVTEVELKSAFRKAAMVHHPDKNPGDKAAAPKALARQWQTYSTICLAA